MYIRQTSRHYTNYFGYEDVKVVLEIFNNGTQLFCTRKELLQISSLLNNPKKKSKKYCICKLPNGWHIQKMYKEEKLCYVAGLTEEDIEIIKSLKTDYNINQLLLYYQSLSDKEGVNAYFNNNTKEDIFEKENESSKKFYYKEDLEEYLKEALSTEKTTETSPESTKEEKPSVDKAKGKKAAVRSNICIYDIDLPTAKGTLWTVKQINNEKTGNFLRLSKEEFDILKELCGVLCKEALYGECKETYTGRGISISKRGEEYHITKGKYFLHNLSFDDVKYIANNK